MRPHEGPAAGSLDTNSGAAGGCGQTPAPEAPPAIGERKTLAGRHSLRSLRNGGKPTGCSAGVGVKRHPPAFSRFGTSGSRRHGDRLAGGSLRCLLTATADELVGRSMVASPDNRRFTSNPETGRHRTCAGVGPSSGPSRPRPVRRVGSSTGFAGTRLAARSWSGSFESRPGRAKLGGTLLTPTPASILAIPLRSHRRVPLLKGT